MNNSTEKTLSQMNLQEIIEKEASDRWLDFLCFDFQQSLEDFLDDVKSQEDEIFNEEIIYFSNAIEYLKENDPSLRNSLELASDLWYDPKNLNSEILASLLLQEDLRTEFFDFIERLESEIDEDERRKDCFNDEETTEEN